MFPNFIQKHSPIQKLLVHISVTSDISGRSAVFSKTLWHWYYHFVKQYRNWQLPNNYNKKAIEFHCMETDAKFEI